MMKTKLLIGLIVAFLAVLPSHARIGEGDIQALNQLVSGWAEPDGPGGVVGIMVGGRVAYLKAFGLASLDYDIPNSDLTLFNLGSVSKQFTAMGIVWLSLQGKLNLDDDIRLHLPDLPDFGHVISIRHLLHHTSGLRDIHSILTLAGWRRDDPRSNEDLFAVMKRQKELNFKPGDEFLYSNTNYIFLARIIEKVSGESFEKWMREKLFLPLGLKKTYVENRATRVVMGNATSYTKPSDEGFTRAVEYWDYTGSGNVHSTAGDLLLWLNQFISPSPGWEKAFELLLTRVPLSDGTVGNYAFGVEVDETNGIGRISHGGSVGGFRAFACVYPEHGIGIVVLTNYTSSNPQGKSQAIAEILLPGLRSASSGEDQPYVDFALYPNDDLKRYEGAFWDGEQARKIYFRDGALWYYRRPGNESPMQSIGPDEFMIMPNALWKVKFAFRDGKVDTMLLESRRVKNHYERFEPVEINAAYLGPFAGLYYSPELDTHYRFTLQDEALIGHHPRHGDFMTEAQPQGDFFKSQGPFQKIRFIRDARGRVVGLRGAFDRVKNLWLEKVN